MKTNLLDATSHLQHLVILFAIVGVNALVNFVIAFAVQPETGLPLQHDTVDSVYFLDLTNSTSDMEYVCCTTSTYVR